VADLLLILEAPNVGVRLAVCMATLLSREASRRHGLSEGSAAALAQGLAGSLLLAATDRPDQPAGARVDVQLECKGPLRGLLVDADGLGTVRGLVRVNVLDRAGERTDVDGPGWPEPLHGVRTHGSFAGASAGPGLQFAPPGPPVLERFDARALLSGGSDAVAGTLSILRAAPGVDALHRALVPFAGSDLGAGLSAYLRGDRALAGELSLEVLFHAAEPLAAVAGALVLPQREDERDEARALGDRLRDGELHQALALVEASAPGNAHALAQRLAERLGLGPLRVESELRPRLACRCSRERVVRALKTLGATELRQMADEDGGAEATCDFCAQTYRITARELLELAGVQ
jgi:molecular chaperone Hsp33